MKKKLRIFGIYLPFYIIALLATLTLRTVACFKDFDILSGYFDDKLLITVSDSILILTLILLFTYIFTAKKDMKLIPSFTSAATYVPTGAVGVSIIFMAVYLFTQYFALRGTEYAMYSVIDLICAVFAILSVVHFILTALVESHSSAARANFGLCTVIFLALYTIHLYFDTSTPLNAPNRLVSEMAYLTAALFFLYETRLSMGRERWREYITFGFISSLLTAYASIPSIITYFVSGDTIANNIYDSVLAFTLFIFITSRLLLTGELIEDKKSSIVEALSMSAAEREAAVILNDAAYEAAHTAQEPEDTEEENVDLQLSLDEEIGISASDEPKADGVTNENGSAEANDETVETNTVEAEREVEKNDSAEADDATEETNFSETDGDVRESSSSEETTAEAGSAEDEAEETVTGTDIETQDAPDGEDGGSV